MNPRTAGILGMVLGLGVCTGGGMLIARPSLWILGVILLTGGTVLCGVSAAWMVRKSWGASDWPDVSMPAAKRRRRILRALTVQCILAPTMIGFSMWQIFGESPILGWFYLVWGVVLLVTSVWTLRAIAKKEVSDPYFGV